MAAGLNDKFRKVGASTVTTLAAPGKALAASAINVGSTTNYPTDTGIVIAIRQVDTSGTLVPGTYTEWDATVTSATSLGISTTPRLGTDQVYPAASTTQVFMVVSAPAHNDLIDGILEEHGQDGGHTDITADSITAPTGNITNLTVSTLQVGSQTPSADWTASVAPDSVTYNGNKSYDLVFNATDLTGAINPGTRLRTTRTVAAPNRSTSLNGTSQYWNDTTVTGMTFTDDFVVSAWVKLSSYGSTSVIASRYNGTSGWAFFINSDGTAQLIGYNSGAANFSRVISYQSVPLNRWFHITAQLDMSTFTTTPTTSYIMFDGLDIPASVTRGGTNPTALVQAGNLEVGTRNGGDFFPGKIAQVAIFNAKVTQATIRGYISQGLLGTETSLISAYSFNGTANDLNTTNANNLTAQGSATATNADSPFGGQANGTISTTLDYAIVQSTSFSTNTTITVQVPEGCTIPTTGGVSAMSYSSAGKPYGMPTVKKKWNIEYKYKIQVSQAVVSTSAWLNHNNVLFNLPAGEFDAQCRFFAQATTGTVGFVASKWGLAPTSNGNPQDDLSTRSAAVSAATTETDSYCTIEGPVSNSGATTWYLVTQPSVINGATTNYFDGSNGFAATFKFYNSWL